jgi:hypothetical protein
MLFLHPYKILNPFHSTICGLTCMTSRYPEHVPFVPSLQCVPRICFEIITSDVLVSNHYSWLPQGKYLCVIWETLPGDISHSWSCRPFLWKILFEQAFMVQEIPLTQPLLLRENHGCRLWPLLSCYAREGTAVPGHNTLTAVPIQIKLSFDNSSDSRPVKKRTKR